MTTAASLLSLLEVVVGSPLPVRIRSWDGSEAGGPGGPTVVFRRRRALRRLLWAPNELGLARAYVSGDMDVEGDVYEILGLQGLMDRLAARRDLAARGRDRRDAVRLALRLRGIGPPPRPPAEEVRFARFARHTKRRDARAISHHYDVGNDFYRIVLGPTMTYSCGYWARQPGPAYTLDDAQRDKCELICAKLGLAPGMRLLDVGCGWGTLLMHAAEHHGVTAVGVTISAAQVGLARERVAAAGLSDRVEVRLLDYRDVDDGPYDAIASVGMSEHAAHGLPDYAARLATLLRPGGRLLNHAIAAIESLPERPGPPTFIDRYVFPGGGVMPLSRTLDAMERCGLEVRDVQSLREHYALTLRAWVSNLRREWDEAERLVGPTRARIWLLYLAGSALAFEHAGLTVHQVLAVKPGGDGASGLPQVHRAWLPDPPTLTPAPALTPALTPARPPRGSRASGRIRPGFRSRSS